MKDKEGRAFPGYPDARSPPYSKAKMTYGQCWDESKTVFVRIIDICPCKRPPEQGGENRHCCYKAPHIDLRHVVACLRCCAAALQREILKRCAKLSRA